MKRPTRTRGQIMGCGGAAQPASWLDSEICSDVLNLGIRGHVAFNKTLGPQDLFIA